MVPHLLSADYRVFVFDIGRDRVDAMTAHGAVAADSPAAAARDANVVISAVMSADIPAAHLGPEGILGGMRHSARSRCWSPTDTSPGRTDASEEPRSSTWLGNSATRRRRGSSWKSRKTALGGILAKLRATIGKQDSSTSTGDLLCPLYVDSRRRSIVSFAQILLKNSQIEQLRKSRSRTHNVV
jgi:hypothetical protein